MIAVDAVHADQHVVAGAACEIIVVAEAANGVVAGGGRLADHPLLDLLRP